MTTKPTYFRGTCVDCPEIEGEKQPLRCANAARYDHKMLGPPLVDDVERVRAFLETPSENGHRASTAREAFGRLFPRRPVDT